MSRTPKIVQKMKTLILPKGLTLKVKKVRSPSSEVKSRRNKLKTQKPRLRTENQEEAKQNKTKN